MRLLRYISWAKQEDNICFFYKGCLLIGSLFFIMIHDEQNSNRFIFCFVFFLR
jgi:hypothetical protein